MKITSWRRNAAPAMWVLLVVVGAPGLAEAQQGGLFPLRNTHSKQEYCAEQPWSKQYRQEYFGYYPTCWRRFPEGWGCPSPEAPDVAASFRNTPLDQVPKPPPTDLGPDDAMAPPAADDAMAPPGTVPAPNPNNLPPLPSGGERSPFDLDTQPTPPRANPTPGGAADPRPSAPPGMGSIDPRRRIRPVSSLRGLDPESTLASASDDGPPSLELPVMPEPSTPLAPGATLETMPVGLNAPGPFDPATDLAPVPVQAPKRRRVLGSLFREGGLFRR